MSFKVDPRNIGEHKNAVVKSFLDTLNPLAPLRAVGTGPPFLEPWDSFYPDGSLYFLSKILPLEVWYIIYEWKFWLEKVDYVMTYFGPSVVDNIRKSKEGRWVLSPSIPSLATTLYQEVKSLLHMTGEPCRGFNILQRFKWFLVKWYPVLETLERIHDRDGHFETDSYRELFNKQDTERLSAYKILSKMIREKVEQFYIEIVENGSVNCCQNHAVVAKIMIHDMRRYLDFQDSIFEPLRWYIDDPYDADFQEYFENFEMWHLRCWFQEPLDVLDLVTGDQRDYVNPFWFQVCENGQTAIWNMVNGEL